ncbi:MAG: PQQ-binding-like beta-propeller repeat protein, partial [Planctomycetes bacterium]|nr:PQQ-binding-like beta-propeller repeat protein [Planctomycetota bacterium]
LRRQLISILDNQTGETKTLEKHLKELAAEDPDSRHQCWLRLALLYAQKNNSSSARRKIGNIDFSAIQNAALLSRAYGKLHNMLDEKQRLSLSRQLVELEPGSLSHWEKRLMVLAVSAREEKLRSTLEQLRLGNDKISLPEKTKNLLKAHQLASCWRSIAYRLTERRTKDLHQALRLTKDAAELISNSEQNLWVRWTQAYILRVMGRKKAARNATERFRKATQKVKDKHDSASVMIRFPDGLTLGRKHARKLLGNSEKNDAKQTKPSTTHIDKPLRVKWAFESNSDSPITAIEPLSKNRILLCDSYGELTCLNSQTGKLIWQKTDLLSPAETFVKAATTVAKTNPSTVALRSGPTARRIWRASSHPRDRALKLGPAKPVADDRGRIYFPRAGVFDCYEQSNGRFLWSAQVSPGHVPTHAGKKQWPRVCLCPYGGKILAFDPATGVVAAFAASTGKLIWQRLPNEMTNAALPRHSGASLRNGKLLVYGLTTALFDADTGELLWTFEPDRVRSFPIELSSRQPSLDDVKQATGYRIYPSRGSFPSGPPVAIRRSSSQHSVYLNHMAQPRNWDFRSGHRFYPVSPGAAWHGQLRRSSGHSLILADNNVLLFNSQGYSWHLPLEFPLVGETVRIHGACAGIAQNRAIVTYYGRLYAISLESGTTTQRYELSKIMQKGNSRPWIQIVPHGKYAYVTGPAGIMSVEVKTGETQFHQKWPKILQNRGENPEKQESGGSYPRVSSYSGASVYVKLSKNGPSEWIPFTGLIQNQTLYTTYPPWRVVAMESSSE